MKEKINIYMAFPFLSSLSFRFWFLASRRHLHFLSTWQRVYYISQQTCIYLTLISYNRHISSTLARWKRERVSLCVCHVSGAINLAASKLFTMLRLMNISCCRFFAAFSRLSPASSFSFIFTASTWESASVQLPWGICWWIKVKSATLTLWVWDLRAERKLQSSAHLTCTDHLILWRDTSRLTRCSTKYSLSLPCWHNDCNDTWRWLHTEYVILYEYSKVSQHYYYWFVFERRVAVMLWCSDAATRRCWNVMLLAVFDPQVSRAINHS